MSHFYNPPHLSKDSDIMPMSKKQLEKKQQAKKAELAELEKQAAAGDGEAKKKIAKLKKKMK